MDMVKYMHGVQVHELATDCHVVEVGSMCMCVFRYIGMLVRTVGSMAVYVYCR